MAGRRRRIVLLGIAAVLALLTLYLLAWPVGIDPEAWHPPTAPALTGPYAPNRALGAARRVAPTLRGPECVAIGPDGAVYTGTMDGAIVRLRPGGGDPEIVARTGGRPLGLEFDAQGRLVIADANQGLLRLAPGAAAPEVLATGHGGVPFRFVDDVAIARDGSIYFTDASSRWPLRQFKMDVLEHRPSGRVLRYQDGQGTALVADKLYFANGVALAPDDSYLLVAETSSYRVTRVWLAGERAGQREVLVDNLPGFPDNVTWSPARHAFWVAVGSPRDATLDALGPRPFVRKIVARLPDALQPQAKIHSYALAVDEHGAILASLQDAGDGAYGPIASVIEHDGTLWLGSFKAAGLAALPSP